MSDFFVIQGSECPHPDIDVGVTVFKSSITKILDCIGSRVLELESFLARLSSV